MEREAMERGERADRYVRPNPTGTPTHPLLRSSHDPYHVSFHPLHLGVILGVILVVMLVMLFELIILVAFEAMIEPVLVIVAIFVVVIVILVQFGGYEATEVAVRHAQTARNARIHTQRVVRRRVPLSSVLPTPEEIERHALGPFVHRRCTPSSAFTLALAVGVPSSAPSTAEPSPPSHRLIPAPPTSLHHPRRLRRVKAGAQSSSGE